MNANESLALFLSLTAGLSTCIGSIIIFFDKKYNTKVLDFSLGFSAGVMIYIAIGDLLVESQNLIYQTLPGMSGGFFVLLFLLAGMLLAACIETFVPDDPKLLTKKNLTSARLLRVGIVSSLAIVLHNFPEGMATFMAGCQSISLGLPLTLAVGLHNIPEGLTIAMPIYYATRSRKKAFAYTFFAGLAEPFGAVLTYLFLKPFLDNLLLGVVFAIVAGIMLFISFHELLPASYLHGHKRQSLCGVLLGMLIMGLCLMLLR